MTESPSVDHPRPRTVISPKPFAKSSSKPLPSRAASQAAVPQAMVNGIKHATTGSMNAVDSAPKGVIWPNIHQVIGSKYASTIKLRRKSSLVRRAAIAAKPKPFVRTLRNLFL